MSYLLDTNVVSELRRNQPDPAVLAWVEQQRLDRCYLSVLTLGEIAKGIAYLGPSAPARAYRRWLEQDLIPGFAERILSLDEAVMRTWGALVGGALKRGRPLPLLDSLLGATASHFDLILVTRNAKDFAGVDVDLVDPWEHSGSEG